MHSHHKRYIAGAIGCLAVMVAMCVWFAARGTTTPGDVVDRAIGVQGNSSSIIEVIGGVAQNIGDTRKNERRKHVFVMCNKSATQLVHLKSVKASCGCILVDKSYPRSIGPGESCNVAIEIIGKTRTRPINDMYTLTATFDEVPPVRVTFGYRVIEDVAAYPEEVLHGEVFQKDHLAGSILLRPVGSQVLLVKKTNSERGLIRVERCIEEHGGIRCYYTIASTPPGRYEDVLELSTNAAIDAHVRIPFEWEVVPNIAVVPKSIFWNGAEKDDGVKEVVVKSVDDTVFRVTGIDYDKQKLDVKPLTMSDEPVRQARFRIRVNPDAFGSSQFFRQEVVLHTDKGDAILAVFGNNL